MNRIVAIIQARMSANRLPGKVMERCGGKEILWHVINRVMRASTIDHVMVATTTHVDDVKIVDLVTENAAFFHRQYGKQLGFHTGSMNNVLDRYYKAARAADADVVVRITADCPLLSPRTIDDVVTFFGRGNYDYASNVHPPTFSDGLDVEVMTFDVLETAWHEAAFKSEREHVTPFITKHPERFRIGNFENPIDLSDLRWTVDTEQDLAFVRAIYDQMQKTFFTTEEVLLLLQRVPQLANINRGIERNEGYRKSLQEDKE
jgi:spore coat polysaccharide biosynthesis protein SpsF